MKKRLFSFSTLLLCSLLGFAQFSGSGSGTEADPYLITSPDELFEVRNSPSSYYKLMNDIDLAEWLAEESPTQGWVPIPNFSGYFDGNGHSISNLFINRPSSNEIGLFGHASKGATFVNITLINPVIYGNSYIGALLGSQTFAATIDAITVKNAHIEGNNQVGGVLGDTSFFIDGRITNLKVQESVIKGNACVGGCVGDMDYAHYLSNNVVIGCTIIGTEKVGGIAGHLDITAGGTIPVDCYVYECKISGTYNIGGIVGYMSAVYYDHEIRRCYVSGTIVCNGDGTDESRCAGIVAYTMSNNSNHAKTTIRDCRFDGRIIGTATWTAGINAYNVHVSNLNIVSGSIYGSSRVYGIGCGYGCTSSVCCADTIYNTGSMTYRIGLGKGYAYNDMVVYSNSVKVEVEDDNGSSSGTSASQGIGYSLRLLKKRNTYIGFSYDFDETWSIAEDRTFPYLKAQSIPPIITSCVGGQNGIITGTASGNGTIYVFVGNKMYEGEIVNGEWSVPIAKMPRGAMVNVYAETDGMKPSCKISTISEVGESFVELDETSVTVPEAANDVDVLLNRTIKADEWSTICLPFTATGEQVKAAFGDDVQLAEFTAWESEEDVNGAIVGINVTFTPANADDGIAANKPMLIKVSEAVTEATFDGVTLEPEEEPVVQVGKRASERGWFYGTYAVMQVPEENLFLSGNKFWYSTGATTIKGYRGYFEFRDVLDAYYDGSEVKVNFFFDDEETGIRKLTPTLFEVEEVMYNLAGQRVDKAKKGIYIVNGKKQVIK